MRFVVYTFMRMASFDTGNGPHNRSDESLLRWTKICLQINLERSFTLHQGKPHYFPFQIKPDWFGFFTPSSMFLSVAVGCSRLRQNACNTHRPELEVWQGFWASRHVGITWVSFNCSSPAAALNRLGSKPEPGIETSFRVCCSCSSPIILMWYVKWEVSQFICSNK